MRWGERGRCARKVAWRSQRARFCGEGGGGELETGQRALSIPGSRGAFGGERRKGRGGQDAESVAGTLKVDPC